MQPLFGDLVLKGVVVFCFLFVLVLVIDALRQKRQARLMHKLARRQSPCARLRVSPLFNFLGRFGARIGIALVVATLVAAALISNRRNISARAGNQMDSSSLATYATNFHGEGTRQIPVASTVQPEFGETDSISPQSVFVPRNKINLRFEGHESSAVTIVTATTNETNTIASSVSNVQTR